MVPDWYADWIDQHRRAFLLTAEWVDAAAAWWDAFASLGVTPGELAAATREVQLAPAPPKDWGHHLPAVKAAVGAARNRAADRDRRAAEAAGDPGACVDCGNSGWVVVPHPRFLPAGAWEPARYSAAGDPVYVTAAVACSCWKGRATAESLGRQGRRHLTVEQFTLAYPDWRRQLAAATEAGRARRRAEGADPGGLLLRLANGFRVNNQQRG